MKQKSFIIMALSEYNCLSIDVKASFTENNFNILQQNGSAAGSAIGSAVGSVCYASDKSNTEQSYQHPPKE
jgi:hypothetical protein